MNRLNPFGLFKRPRFRNVVLIWGAVFVILAMFMTDPDHGMMYKIPLGASTAAWLLGIAKVVVAVAGSYILTKARFDYKSSDSMTLFQNAKEGNMASAVALLAKTLFEIAVLVCLIGPALS